MGNFTYQKQVEIPIQRSFKISYRYKLDKKFTLGLSYQRMFGQRHNEDWVNPNGTGWVWFNSESRGENYYFPFIQYKTRVSFIDKTAFKTRLAYRYNQFNKQQDIFLKTGIVTILPKKLSLHNQINVIIPTSYGRAPLRDYWTYHSLGYSLSRSITIGIDVSYWKQFWNESLLFKSRTGVEFENTNSTVVYGLFTNYYF